MTKIKFGTDGWRAVVGEDFVPENIARVIQAFCDVYPTLPEAGRPVMIGYDRRNRSPEAARQVAEILLGNGIETVLSSTFCPTPAVSWYVKYKGCAAGVMITASHNPAKWNGIKFKESYGGAASGEYLAPIEAKITANDAAGRKPRTAKIEGNPKFSEFDPYGEYLSAIVSNFDIPKIKGSGIKKVLVDPLYGSGTGYFPRILGDMANEIHDAADVTFGGLNPEPIPPHANELMERVRSGGYSCGLLTDGDADRAGAVDERGNFVTTHEVFSLLLLHALDNKGWTGKVIKSISTTMMLNRICDKHGIELETVPVGFKYISPAMKKPGVLVGGEESGGFGFPRHIPERDGVFSDLMLLEMIATTGKTLGTLVAGLQRDFGPTKYRRLDLHLTQAEIAKAREAMKTLDIREFGGRRCLRHETMDGHHFLFDDDSWLLFRASGTEPLVRVYAEAPSMDEVERMISFGKRELGL
ncbi:MAG: phosphoglucomutase/phosphomannomutase family protein [Proteobacteria bacterium]|nr:phosphoglucomutase/phosphomannomutase family protein [Pseudomonadota bacterium]